MRCDVWGNNHDNWNWTGSAIEAGGPSPEHGTDLRARLAVAGSERDALRQRYEGRQRHEDGRPIVAPRGARGA